MLARRLKEEYGYSLVEVMASIVIMTLAILPMMAMFDTGLRSATTGSNYDKSRTLANLKLEQAKNMPFDSNDETIQDVRDNFPEAAGTTTVYDDGPGTYLSDWKDPALTETAPASTNFANFRYRVEKQYMDQPCTDSTDPADPCPVEGEEDFTEGATPTNLIRVTVTVRWANGNEYTTYGLVTR